MGQFILTLNMGNLKLKNIISDSTVVQKYKISISYVNVNEIFSSSELVFVKHSFTIRIKKLL